jgi:hypothetical protein
MDELGYHPSTMDDRKRVEPPGIDDGPVELDEPHEPTIGRQMAAAMDADARRMASDPPPSPLPSARYDPWLGQLRLYDPVRLPLDDQLTACMRDYRELTTVERTAFRDGVGTGDAYLLLAFARRAAVFALRSGDEEDAADGLTACAAIGYERVDDRDALVALALLHHAIVRCGGDPATSFRDAAALGESAFEALAEGLLSRSAAERDLRGAWGYGEVRSANGVGLLRWGFAPWTPTRDLPAASLRLADALRDDDYLIEDPELAVELPAVWLSATGDPALESILSAARGAAVIQARLRPDVTPTHADQQLTAWLVELSDAAAAGYLEKLSRTARPGDALLGVAAGTLLALVVGRSMRFGVESFENGAKLARFRPAVERALADYA